MSPPRCRGSVGHFFRRRGRFHRDSSARVSRPSVTYSHCACLDMQIYARYRCRQDTVDIISLQGMLLSLNDVTTDIQLRCTLATLRGFDNTWRRGARREDRAAGDVTSRCVSYIRRRGLPCHATTPPHYFATTPFLTLTACRHYHIDSHSIRFLQQCCR